MSKLDKIRARHEFVESKTHDYTVPDVLFMQCGEQAHADRAYLLERIAELEADNRLAIETMNDQAERELALARRLEAAEAALERVRGCIEAEPELPGEMPDEMWQVVASGDRDAATELLRIVVRLTKRGILDRFNELAAALKEGE